MRNIKRLYFQLLFKNEFDLVSMVGSRKEKQKPFALRLKFQISMTHSLKHSVDLEGSYNNRPSKLSKIEHPSHIEEEEEEEEEMNQNPKNGIQRYLFAIEYIGTRFSGSQKQLTCRTVVGALEVSDYNIASPFPSIITIKSNVLLFCRKLLLNLLASPSLSPVQVEL